MVKIPTSPGVQARPQQVTPTVRQPVDTGERFIAQGIGQLGSALAGIGQQAILQEKKEQQAYNASQVIEYKNQLRRFDNQEKIALSEQGATQDVINKSKQGILDRRKLFTDELKLQYADNKEVLGLIDRETKSSFVDLEFNVDKDISKKRRVFGQNQFFKSISDLKEDFENAQSPEELASIANELQIVQETGIASGLINMKDIERIQKDFRKLRKEQEAEARRQAAFAGAVRGELILDSTDKNDKEIINQGFEEYYAQADDPLGAAEQISVNTGIIPDVAKKHWTSTLANGSNQQKIESAQQIVEMQRANPTLQAQFNDRERALARAINNRISIGLTDEQIVEFAETEIDKNKTKEQIVRVQEFDLEIGKSGKKFNEKLEEISEEIKDRSGVPFIDPEVDRVPEEISLDIIRTAKDMYIQQGINIDDSIDEATETVMSQWGITEIGGKRYQKYSPETLYPNFPKKALKRQVLSMAGQFVLDKEALKDSIRLSVIPETLNTEKPSYFVNIEREDGIIDILRDGQNKPVTFTPDITKTKEYQENIKVRESLKFTPKRKAELRKRSREIGQARQKVDPLAIF